MKLIGMMPCRGESWVLGLSLRVALMWCDEVIVCDHQNDDHDRDIMNDVARESGRVVIIEDRETEWREMPQRQMILEAARVCKATHLAIIDADEILCGLRFESEGRANIRGYIAAMPAGHILQLPGYNLRDSLGRYHQNGIWGNRWFSLAYADEPCLGWNGDKFHSREPKCAIANRPDRGLIPYKPISQGQGGIMHLWGLSDRRLKAKSALYKVTERLRWPDKPTADIELMYSWAIKGQAGHPSFGTPETWTYTTVPESWWEPYSHLMKYLDVDAEPWQEKAVRDIVFECGEDRFKGLDLFGVV